MGQVITVIFLAIAIPAWALVIIRETVTGRASRRQFDSAEAQRLRMKELLTPTEEDIEWVNKAFSTRDVTAEEWRDRLLYQYGIAEEFRAIYGERWEECAVFGDDRQRSWLGRGWDLKGFHNSPINDKLWISWKENDAVKALLYSKRGKIPPNKQYEPYINIIPYSYTDWNFDNGVRWYRRIEENLRHAGADVTMYFNKDGFNFDYGGGPYFVQNGSRITRW